MFDVHDFMKELATKRPIFHSEADFQHAFAWQFHEQNPNAGIRLEYPIDKGMHLDILAANEEFRFAVELKYKTKKFEADFQKELFNLRGHSAADGGRYDFLKDVVRLEYIKKQIGIDGYAIFLTNDAQYWAKGRENTLDMHFRLHEGRVVSGQLNWFGKPAQGTTRGKETILSITGSYTCNWRIYSLVSEKEFRYLALKI